MAEERTHGVKPGRQEECRIGAKAKPRIGLNLWLETTEGVLFGMGRAELLDKIEECGSLKKAAEEMGMSYRAAWGNPLCQYK